MNVYRNTPIDHFAGSQGLSVRSVNVCKSNGIRTLGDLLDCTPEEIHGLRNCGAKSSAELNALRHRYFSAPADLFTDILRRGLQSSFLKAKEKLTPQQAALIEKAMGAFGVDASTTGRFIEAPFIFIDSVCNAAPDERDLILSAMSTLFEYWKIEADGDNESVNLLKANAEYVEQLRARYEAEDIYNSLSAPLRNLLSRRYRQKFELLSVRTKNALAHLGNLKDAVPYIFGVKTLNSQKLKKAGARTIIEMQSFLNANKGELLDIFTASTDDNEAWKKRVERMFASDIAARFPFLTTAEVTKVALAECNGKNVSPYYLLERFVMHSASRPAKVYALRYSIGTTNDRQHFSVIGKELGMSGERVRQLLAARLHFPDELETLLKNAFGWLNGNLSSQDEKYWADEHKNAGLEISIHQFMALATAIKPEYVLVQLAPEASAWLIKRELLANVNLMTTLRQLSQTIEMRRTRRETFHIAPYIYMGRERGEFHPDVTDLNKVYLDCLTKIYDNVNELDNNSFTAEPNKLDVIDAVEKALESIGRSASYKELCRVFDAANPGQLNDTNRQLRSYIFRSKHIVPVGRSGRYVMKHWNNAFSGTVTQCMAMELQRAGRPLSAPELHKRVSEYFPSTTINSLNVFAYLDKGRTIVILPDHRYAPAGEGYEVSDNPARRSVSFDERMEQLKLFVGQHHRFPLLSDNNSVSLRRWLDNIRHGVIVLEPHQRNQLDEFLRANDSLPTTSSQATFRDHVHSIMRHVCRHGAMPTAKNGTNDYHWLQRVRQCRNRYGDIRDVYRTNLSNFLTNFGYSI